MFFSERKRIVMRRQRKEGEEIGRDKQPGAGTRLQKGLEKFIWKEQVGACPAWSPHCAFPPSPPAGTWKAGHRHGCLSVRGEEVDFEVKEKLARLANRIIAESGDKIAVGPKQEVRAN